MIIVLDEKTKHSFFRKSDGHIYIDIPVICDGSSDDDTISFIYDTGAFITVVNRDVYETLGLHRLQHTKTVLGGYAGGAPGYLFQLPGLKIGTKLLIGVWAFSPESYSLRQNLLGSNVIEYFCPYQDNTHDYIYFPSNSMPKPYHSEKHNFSLACDKVLFIGDE